MELLSKNKIKEKVGNAWALIYDPVFSDKTDAFLKGKLIFWHKDKNEVYDKAAKDKTPGLYFTIQPFGELEDEPVLLNFF